jgi:hypothetical protein
MFENVVAQRLQPFPIHSRIAEVEDVGPSAGSWSIVPARHYGAEQRVLKIRRGSAVVFNCFVGIDGTLEERVQPPQAVGDFACSHSVRRELDGGIEAEKGRIPEPECLGRD